MLDTSTHLANPTLFSLTYFTVFLACQIIQTQVLYMLSMKNKQYNRGYINRLASVWFSLHFSSLQFQIQSPKFHESRTNPEKINYLFKVTNRYQNSFPFRKIHLFIGNITFDSLVQLPSNNYYNCSKAKLQNYNEQRTKMKTISVSQNRQIKRLVIENWQTTRARINWSETGSTEIPQTHNLPIS